MTERRRHRGRFWIIGGLILALALVIWLVVGRKPASPARSVHRGGQAQSVAVATIGRGDIRLIDVGLGTVTPIANILVRTQINGLLLQVAFREGQLVRKGDFLEQIDPRPYQVALQQAEGALFRDQAALRIAQLDQTRYHVLLKQNAVARQTVDQQDALVLQSEGNVKTDQAQIASAKLNLIYCHITAPVTGRVGLRQVDQGNYVQTGDTNGLVLLTQLDPISVIFTLPEDDLPLIGQQPGGQDGRPPPLIVQAWDRADQTLLATGQLDTTDNAVDTTTGTVKLRAMFANPAGRLFPNQFVNAHLLVQTDHDVLRVPASAVQTGEPGRFVYLLRDHTVEVRKLVLGPQDGDWFEVRSGLQAGDRVVTDGTDKLRDGAPVRVPDDSKIHHHDAAPAS